MPKVNNTHKQKRAELFRRITPDVLFNGPFSNSNGAYDQKIIDSLKARYQLYFDTWVKDDAELYILNKKEPK